ncbi:MAG: hypothetical protein VX633_14305 [Verrucomicrobiota bacterium]|nr:hypothetical protein [Roseibacillus sp.]MEC9056485.1 hypothetical protein [Verrucomicrobiota bacterium]
MKIISLIACALMLTLSSAFAGPVNKNCPVKGKAVDGSTAVEVKVGFCCGRCLAKFDKDPVALLAKVAKTAEGKCPISGRDVDEDATSTISVAVCCKGCKGKVEKDPKKFLAEIAKTEKPEKKDS